MRPKRLVETIQFRGVQRISDHEIAVLLVLRYVGGCQFHCRVLCLRRNVIHECQGSVTAVTDRVIVLAASDDARVTLPPVFISQQAFVQLPGRQTRHLLNKINGTRHHVVGEMFPRIFK